MPFRTIAPIAPIAVIALVACACSMPLHAADDAASSAQTAGERSRIASERARVESQFTATERECERHFVVTSCVDDAKRTRREALDKLRTRQLAVDETVRHDRAAERRKELAEKIEDDAKRDAARAHGTAGTASAPSSAASSGASGASEGRAATSGSAGPASAPVRAKPRAGGGLPKPRPPDSAAVRKERESTNRRAYDQRQADADEHRSESTARTARRLAGKPAAASLPSPAAPQASGSTRTNASDKLSPDPRAR